MSIEPVSPVAGSSAAGDTAVRVTIAMATYLRPDDLHRCLTALTADIAGVRASGTPDRIDVLVVDNDAAGSGRSVAGRFDDVRYVVEPEPGISAARNRALAEAADSTLLIFIDDDEEPILGWLALMLDTWRRYGADGVAGRVISRFSTPLDPWVEAGGFFTRRTRPTGNPVPVAATNNLLLDLRTVRRAGLQFDPRFGLSGGGDTHFTRSLVRAGARLVWCDEAVVYDHVPPSRATREWVLKRARRVGNTEVVVAVDMARTPVEQIRARTVGSVRGVGRIAIGLSLYLLGVMTRSTARQARGLRKVWRGSGMISGAMGKKFSEYLRPGGAESAAVTGGSATG